MEKIDSKVINAPIRWAGSKKKLLNEMLHAFEADKDVYIEPFLGSGIVLLNVLENQMYRKYYVNDINNNLILFYNTLKPVIINLLRNLSSKPSISFLLIIITKFLFAREHPT